MKFKIDYNMAVFSGIVSVLTFLLSFLIAFITGGNFFLALVKALFISCLYFFITYLLYYLVNEYIINQSGLDTDSAENNDNTSIKNENKQNNSDENTQDNSDENKLSSESVESLKNMKVKFNPLKEKEDVAIKQEELNLEIKDDLDVLLHDVESQEPQNRKTKKKNSKNSKENDILDDDDSGKQEKELLSIDSIEWEEDKKFSAISSKSIKKVEAKDLDFNAKLMAKAIKTLIVKKDE